jgi:hypothetical protein
MFLRGKYEYAFRPTWRKRSGFIGRADEKELFESALANLMAESRRETHEALWPGLAGDIPLAGKTVAPEIRRSRKFRVLSDKAIFRQQRPECQAPTLTCRHRAA